MTRVALFGGSFNPPHVAHELVALYVLETQPIDELWFLPVYHHVFDTKQGLAPFEDSSAATASPAALRHALDVNLIGTANFCRASAPALKEGGWGKVVTLSSLGALRPMAGGVGSMLVMVLRVLNLIGPVVAQLAIL